jgi:branched-chain amino acid transport system ATP-binding protein
MALLEVERLSIRFGGVAAISDLSLSVEAGEIHGLIGPNGAGKTSLVNAVTGVVPVQQGTIRFDRENITRLAPHAIAARGVGRTFQHGELFSDRTVLENALTGFYRREAYGVIAAAIGFGIARSAERRSEEQGLRLLEDFNLRHVARSRTSDLPFGLQKRVDMARALASNPRLLLLDEPVSGMSEAEADSAVATIRRLTADHAITLVVVEHNMRVLMKLADRVTVLNYGKLLARGRPDEVRADPAVIHAYLGEQT